MDAYPVSGAVQFAVGGLAFPPRDQWVSITERVRGRAVRELCRALTGDPQARYGRLSPQQRLEISLLAGKDAAGKPLSGHSHAYFVLWPDEHDQPSRLIAWRRAAPFTTAEVTALFRAVEKPVPLASGEVYLVLLPVAAPLPRALSGPASVWHSATPFVPPSNRHRFRHGRLRNGEAPERLAERLLMDLGFPNPQAIAASAANSARLHRSRQSRGIGVRPSQPLVRSGYNLVIRFPEPVHGPILIGDSCHFGLGAFRALERANP